MDPTPKRFEMEKFDGKGDFGLWKYKMLGQLEIQGLISVLKEDAGGSSDSEQKESQTESKPDPKWLEKDLRVRNLLGTCLSDIILRKVMNESSALGMWKALERDYQTKSLLNRIYLKQKFASYKMDANKSIEENLDGFLKLIADLASLKITISDEDQAIKILSSLPPAYDSLVHTLKYGRKDTLTVSEVTSSAYAKEVELQEKGLLNRTKTSSEGHVVETRGRTEKRTTQQWRNRSKGRGK